MGPSERVAAPRRQMVTVRFLRHAVRRAALPLALLAAASTATSCDSAMMPTTPEMSAVADMLACQKSAVCNGQSVCLDNSPDHCGGCNNPCNQAGLICREGRCEKVCNPDGGMKFNDAGVQVILTYCDVWQECYDITSDRNHCGDCTTVCNQDQKCTDGKCILNCVMPLVACGDKCVNTSIDRANCGACGKGCPIESPLCVDGKCTSACPLDTTDCPGVGCVNPYNDPAHCGGCQGCQMNQVCSNKQCKLACDQGTTKCLDNNGASRCANLASDPANCGACRNACAANTVCSNGQCVGNCGQGYTLCKDKNGSPLGCFDLQSDPAHCGTCPTDDMTIAAGALCKDQTPFCVGGKCVGTCPFMNCNGACVDFDTDPHNCGACADPAKGLADPHICRLPGQVCYQGTCIDAQTCPKGTIPCGRTCVACDPPHGAAVCDTMAEAYKCKLGACEAGYTDCDKNPFNGCEIHTDADTNNCGICKQVCNVSNGSPSCVSGICTVGSCIAGWGDCKNGYSDGCETNIDNEVQSCGACGNACAVLNGTPSCSKGKCVVASCGMGFEDCDKQYANGCEINTQNDTLNCGACGKPCSPPHATPACAAGACQVGKCDLGWLDCNGNAADGCEVNSVADPTNCGACGKTCTAPNASGSCTNSTCNIVSCTKGYGDCDKVFGNGCETALDAVQNCGICGLVCPQPQQGQPACNSGVCGVGGCAQGFADCDNSGLNGCEVNVQIDAKNCGGCGNICPALPHALPACSAGRCGLTCIAPYADCDGQLNNGCETDTSANTAACGGCGVVCNLPNASPNCVASSCVISRCGDGYADCNSKAVDGCEINLTSDVANCGSCGISCPVSTNASASKCVAKACAVASCQPGFADCDGIYLNGCEVNTTTSVQNCGGCGHACGLTVNSSNVVCTQSACAVQTCNVGFADCNKQYLDGCEVNTTTDALNCNGCGNACQPTANVRSVGCTASACSVGQCNPGTADCNKKFVDGCEIDTTNDVANCGGCGNACLATAAVATTKCVSSTCGVATCTPGFADCNNKYTDGCEVNIGSDPNNCNGCGTVCPLKPNVATVQCGQGSCKVATCLPGWADCNGQFNDGCEVDLTSDVDNCRACGNRCVLTTGVASAICDKSNCAVGTCQPGLADCDKVFANGCETDTTSNALNCGACGKLCTSTANVATAGCTNSACAVVACSPGFADCNKQYLDGCEINVTNNVNNCNGCGQACALTQNALTIACSSGACGVSSCVAPWTDCNRQFGDGCEVNTNTDPANCGSCNKACVPTANVSKVGCANGACIVATCNGTTADCNQNFSDGCEANLATSVSNCGACGTVCTLQPNTTSVGCGSGTCVVTGCAGSYLNCNNQYLDGCEINGGIDVSNCGACGRTCVAPQNANVKTVACTGSCGVGTCNTGFADCDKDLTDGCEVNTSNDVNNCGACGTKCATGASCVMGACVCPMGTPNACNGVCVDQQTNVNHCGACGLACALGANVTAESCSAGTCVVGTCSAGFADCNMSNGDGCEVNKNTDANNCGACGNKCPTGASCTAGVCACPQGQTACNGACVNLTTNLNNCGACGMVCPTPGANAVAVCIASNCGLACNAGFADCNAVFGDGCEINTNTSASNCGSCGTVCPNGAACTNGTCGCPQGQSVCSGVCVNKNTDTSNCGSCGNVCATGASCTNGTCACPQGQSVCSGACVNKNTDASNCGTCGTKCATGATCTNGVCVCPMGQSACNGVCINTITDTNNCGSCGKVCTPGTQVATVACTAGSCVVSTCNAGFDDCNSTFNDGCETNLNTSAAHCGQCNTACGNNKICSSGICCTTGQTACNGTCFNLQTSEANCGTCGVACAMGQTCTNGMCQ